MYKILITSAIAISLTACASITNDTSHPMKLETKTAQGQLTTDADCSFTNDYGISTGKSGGSVSIRRSSKDLDIVCKKAGLPDAMARLISRANGGMFGNILFGGGIGAIIDHNKGTAYTYPTWIQMVFGSSLVFDRTNEKEGQPTPAGTSK